MNTTGKTKSQKQTAKANPLEGLANIATSTAKQMTYEASRIPQDFMKELLGIKPPEASHFGEIAPGETVEMNTVFSNQHQEIIKNRKQIAFERKLLQQEKIHVEKTTNELKVHLSVIQREIISLAEKTEGLAKETEIAAMQVTVEPGIYHVIFFQKLFEFIQSFKKKIEEAAVWLHVSNKRASKKNRWGANFKKHGAKYLLSSEHYVARSAG